MRGVAWLRRPDELSERPAMLSDAPSKPRSCVPGARAELVSERVNYVSSLGLGGHVP